MEKSSKTVLLKKNPYDNKSLAIFNNILKCSKCKKYNYIMDQHKSIHGNYQNCQSCFNPNYIKK